MMPVRLSKRVLPMFVGACVTASVVALPARADQNQLLETEPAALVESMSRALRELNYEGTFVHMQGMHLSSMWILHANDGGGELERMISLDGEAREVIRDHSLVTCIWPGSRSVIVSKSKPRRLLPDVDAALADNERYVFKVGGTDRVAGRDTVIVDIAPRDSYRYGYRFWVDAETRMLLRSKLLDGDKAIEQVLFTGIDFYETIDRSRFDIDDDDERISWIEPKRERLALVDPGTPAVSRGDDMSTQPVKLLDRVRFAALPEGYRELSERYEQATEAHAARSHVMVTDGMASVSVYVEFVAAELQDRSIEGMSTMGAMNAYGLGLADAFVTAVGEVPGDTVKSIAEAVRLVE